MRECCLLVALAILVQSCSGSLIVGGKESTPNSRPYQVAIMSSNKFQFCGGTLVHESWVVSAAHCIGFGSVYVGLGYHKKKSHNLPGQQYIKAKWVKHENFNPSTLDNDIALLHLDTPATLNDKVQPIKIAYSTSQPADGTDVLVSGWGRKYDGASTTPDELREVVVQVVSHSKCNADYNGVLTQNMWCAAVDGGGKDACQGDSGGPIVSNFFEGSHNPYTTLEGIVSWGYGCANAQWPGVYTKVTNYCSWLDDKTSGDVTC